MASLFNEIIKTTSTPIKVRFSGVDFPAFTDIEVTIETDIRTKLLNASSVVTDVDDITLLTLFYGDTTLDVGTYTLHVKVTDATFPNGLILSDCVIGCLKVKVRDLC